MRHFCWALARCGPCSCWKLLHHTWLSLCVFQKTYRWRNKPWPWHLSLCSNACTMQQPYLNLFFDELAYGRVVCNPIPSLAYPESTHRQTQALADQFSFFVASLIHTNSLLLLPNSFCNHARSDITSQFSVTLRDLSSLLTSTQTLAPHCRHSDLSTISALCARHFTNLRSL